MKALMSKVYNRLLSGKFIRELDKEFPLYYYPIYTFTSGPCYNNVSTALLALKAIHLPHVNCAVTVHPALMSMC